MQKGIVNSKPVQEMVGKRIELARKSKKLSRSALAELLIKNELCPVVTTRKNTSDIKTPAEALTDRLKQWEYGNNPVDLEFIPAICKVLECDVGYLFAEYKEKSRISSDLCSVTGLSEKAVNKLIDLPNSDKESVDQIFIDYLLCSDDLPQLLEIAHDHSLSQFALIAAKKEQFNIGEAEMRLREQTELAEYRLFKTVLDIIRKFSDLVSGHYLWRRKENG